tara:strand:+ start:488 stop:1219 length:732 start_codon:yes stop_codon:yes gene_type:complete
MELRSFIEGFEEESLKSSVKHVAIHFCDVQSSYVDGYTMEHIEKYLKHLENTDTDDKQYFPWYVSEWEQESKENENILTVHRLLLDGELPDFIDWLEATLAGINDATIRALLESYSHETLDSLSSGALRPAVILTAIPEDDIRTVSLANNIDITNTTESKFLGGLFSSGPNWTLVEKVAEQIAGPDKAQQGISLFCPDCAEDAPAGADHCISCGRELPLIICASCDTENLPQAKFCMSCGEKR